ncbi:MAG: DUF1636 domain-containing protein [Pseudomonadota bacterium]
MADRQHGPQAVRPNLPPHYRQVGRVDDTNLILSICLRCRDGRETRDADLSSRGGRRLAEAVARGFAGSCAAQRGVGLRGVNCMSQCKRPCTIALSGPGRFTYLFGDLDPAYHAEDVRAVAAAYAEAELGFLPRGTRPAVLQAGILGRIPPRGLESNLIEPLHATAPNFKTGEKS